MILYRTRLCRRRLWYLCQLQRHIKSQSSWLKDTVLCWLKVWVFAQVYARPEFPDIFARSLFSLSICLICSPCVWDQRRGQWDLMLFVQWINNADMSEMSIPEISAHMLQSSPLFWCDSFRMQRTIDAWIRHGYDLFVCLFCGVCAVCACCAYIGLNW